ALSDVDNADVSPGPCSTRLPRVGSFFQMQARALVGAVLAPYDAEDAELHASGLARWRSYFARQRARHRAQDDQSVGRAHQRLGRALRVGHQAEYVTLSAKHAGDVVERSVGVVEVAEGDAILGRQFVERALVGVIAAF